MNPSPVSRRRAAVSSSLSLILALAASPSLHAQDGEWTLDANGAWSSTNTDPWVDGEVAQGANATASFTAALTGDRTVTLGAPLTIGHLVFGSAPLSHNWTIAGTGNNKLTLATDSGFSTITVNGGGGDLDPTASISAVLEGGNGLVKAGDGIVLLRSANTYAGGTSINAGTLGVTSSSALGSGAVTVASGAQLQLRTVAGIANDITLNGGTIQIWSGNGQTHNNFSGTITLQADSALKMKPGSTAPAWFASISGTLDVGAHTFAIEPNSANGRVYATGELVGSGNIVLNGNNLDSQLHITRDNSGTWAGTTHLQFGTLAIGHDGALGTGTLNFDVAAGQAGRLRSTDTTARTLANRVTLGGDASSLHYFGHTAASANGSLIFTNTTVIDLGDTVRRFLVQSRTVFEAGFTGAGGIRKESVGTLVLNGDSTYTGITQVYSGGTLLVNGSLHADSAVTVNSGGRIGGTGSVGHVTFSGGAGLAYEVADVSQTAGLSALSFTGGGLGGFTLYLTGPAEGFDAGAYYSWEVLNSTSVSGFNLDNITLNLTGFGHDVDADLFNLSITGDSLYVGYSGVIPEPSVFALLAGGALFAFVLGCRRRGGGAIAV